MTSIDLGPRCEYDETMSDTAHHDEQAESLAVVTVEEAMRTAKPWTWDEPSALEDITHEEWDAFIRALESR